MEEREAKMIRRTKIILNLQDPDFESNEARLKYEDEHYDDEYEREKDDRITGDEMPAVRRY